MFLKAVLGYTTGTVTGAAIGGSLGIRSARKFVKASDNPGTFAVIVAGGLGGAAAGAAIGFGATGMILLILK